MEISWCSDYHPDLIDRLDKYAIKKMHTYTSTGDIIFYYTLNIPDKELLSINTEINAIKYKELEIRGKYNNEMIKFIKAFLKKKYRVDIYLDIRPDKLVPMTKNGELFENIYVKQEEKFDFSIFEDQIFLSDSPYTELYLKYINLKDVQVIENYDIYGIRTDDMNSFISFMREFMKKKSDCSYYKIGILNQIDKIIIMELSRVSDKIKIIDITNKYIYYLGKLDYDIIMNIRQKSKGNIIRTIDKTLNNYQLNVIVINNISTIFVNDQEICCFKNLMDTERILDRIRQKIEDNSIYTDWGYVYLMKTGDLSSFSFDFPDILKEDEFLRTYS